MQPWKTRDRRTVWERPPWLTVEQHTIELPDGRVIPDWAWVITPDYVNIVAVTTDQRWLCFRQTKYAVQGSTLALVGGYMEPGEQPLPAAQRELREETGYEADTWTALGHYAVDGNRGAGTAHLYMAQGARRVAAIASDDLEEQEQLLLTRAEVEQALLRGEFKVLPWAAAVALALARTI
ncbi:MAG: NUDIX hydrolase [Chloroflexi bacterium]|jgi:ADP-ribose pyrophosphatase|nr:NUDIX hydrolase [Chloroflexota bacterium]